MGWPGETFLIRMLEVLEANAISPYVKPAQIRREGMIGIELQRQQMLMVAETEREVDRIKATLPALRAEDFSSEIIAGPGAHWESIDKNGSEVEGALKRDAFRGLRKERNVAQAIIRAAVDAEQLGEIPMPDRTPDEDWLHRWRDSAAEVSNEEVRELWGRVLTREFRAPGSFSLRTLDLLRSLDSRDAALIEKLASVALQRSWVFCDTMSLTANDVPGLTFSELLSLQELGLLAGVEGAGLTVIWQTVLTDRFGRAVEIGDSAIVVERDDAEAQLELIGYKVTTRGLQLLSLVDAVPNMVYAKRFANYVRGLGFSAEMREIVGRDGGLKFGSDVDPL